MSEYRTTSVRAIIRRENLVLVEWFEPKKISFLPGGTKETQESLIETLSRELREELKGVTTTIGCYRGKIGHLWATEEGKDSCLNHFFDVLISSDNQVRSGEASRDIRWLDLYSEAVQTLKPPSLRRLLLESQKRDGEWNLIDSEL